MKKLLVSMVMIFVLLLSLNVQAGQPLGSLRHWIAPPHSIAFGKSLNGWMEAYVRWLEDGADPNARIGNVAFLPIFGGPEFEPIEVEPGTALVLPVATWLGFPGDPIIPDEYFGDPDFIYGEVKLDPGPGGEGLIVEINENYYVGPTDLDPDAILFGEYIIDYYQALVCLILPLPPGEHTIELESYFKDIPPQYGVTDVHYENTWIITVLP